MEFILYELLSSDPSQFVQLIIIILHSSSAHAKCILKKNECDFEYTICIHLTNMFPSIFVYKITNGPLTINYVDLRLPLKNNYQQQQQQPATSYIRTFPHFEKLKCIRFHQSTPWFVQLHCLFGSFFSFLSFLSFLSCVYLLLVGYGPQSKPFPWTSFTNVGNEEVQRKNERMSVTYITQ